MNFNKIPDLSHRQFACTDVHVQMVPRATSSLMVTILKCRPNPGLGHNNKILLITTTSILSSIKKVTIYKTPPNLNLIS